MKLAACAALCAATLALSRAGECTTKELDSYQSSDDVDKVKAACTGLELNEHSQPKDYREFCKNATCFSAIKAAQAALPNCTTQGVLLSEVYSPEAMDKACAPFIGLPSTGSAASSRHGSQVVMPVVMTALALAVGATLS